jgi:alkylhydroperoxidase family enzyme
MHRTVLALCCCLIGSVAAAEDRPRPSAFVPLLSQEQASQALSLVVSSDQPGAEPPLPLWALATARALPRTTAAMLDLDWRHRAASPLDPRLRGQIRMIVAQANRCAYAEAQAKDDLRRAGLSDADISTLLADDAKLPAALVFARKLTLTAYAVTDAEVAHLERALGDKQLVAVVQLVAFANFQDRLLLALGITRELGGPLPPHRYRSSGEAKAMPRAAWPMAPAAGAPGGDVHDAEWRALSWGDLKKQMAAQKERPPRLRVPTWEEVKPLLPAEARKRELRIKWSLVCLGYQPELAQGWSACTRAFGTEAAMDRVFEESLFWVVTRTLQCFY